MNKNMTKKSRHNRRKKKYDYDASNKRSKFESASYEFGFGFRYGELNKNHKYYIENKYANIKDEAINNEIEHITNFHWEKMCINAENMLESDECREMKARPYRGLNTMYKIKVGSEISIEHVQSLLLYTNYSEYQKKMKQTMRKSYENEDVHEVMARNRNFAHFCGLLYRVTSFFSSLHSETKFYHGISTRLLFKQFYCNFYMPISTTVNRDAALTFCGHNRNGILLTFQSSNSSKQIYTLALDKLSAYPNERERLFFEATLAIKNIQNLRKPMKKYKTHIKMVLLYDAVTHGQFLSTLKISKSDTEKLLLILQKIMKSSMQNQIEDKYMSETFENYYRKNKLIWINFDE
eukprot:8620_1